MMKHPLYKVLLALLAMVMLITACTTPAPAPTQAPAEPGGQPAATQPPAEPGGEVEPPAEPAEPSINDTRPLVVAMPNDVTTFEPNQLSTRTDSNIAEHMFDRLLYMDANQQLQPMLATSWELLEDNKTWQFKLRDDVYFWDGEHFNAETVKFVIERGLDPQYNWTGNTPGYIFNSIGVVGAEVVDEYTVNIILSGFQPDAPGYLGEVFMHPIKYYQENDLEYVAQNPMGCGPYKLVKWVKDDQLVLERWDDYWGELPPIKTIIFRPIPEASTAVAELLAGNVHVVSKVPPDQSPTIDAADGVHMAPVKGGRRIYIGFQQTCNGDGCEAVRDVRVRQALNMAVDVQTILDGLFYGQGEREGGMVNPPHKNPEVKAYPYDPERAKELLAEAGYPDCFSTTLATPNGRYSKDKEIAMAVAADLAKIGCNIEVVPYEWTTYQTMIRSKELPALYLLGTGSSFLSAWYDLSDLVSVEASTNYVNWQNDEWDELVAQLAETYDPEERKVITDRLQMIVHEDAPWLFIYMQVDWYAVSDLVDWTPRPDEIMDFRHTSFIN